MTEERPSYTVHAPASVLPTTLTSNPFVLEKHAVALLGNGSILSSVVIIAAQIPTTTPFKFRSVIYAQRGTTIKLQEGLDIISQLSQSPPPYISFSGNKYIITSVQEKTYYGRNSNTKIGNGIIIVKLEKIILLAVYHSSIWPVEAIPYVESFMHENLV
eukprot:Phypoly_transcript_10682.p1 GENE.Phypoly_transcript_10682~~Phypoly_transcript_10682.p1  ORF type:complete len:159 (-),score=18.64 Phypoly_transcript_10682:249-725(-)